MKNFKSTHDLSFHAKTLLLLLRRYTNTSPVLRERTPSPDHQDATIIDLPKDLLDTCSHDLYPIQEDVQEEDNFPCDQGFEDGFSDLSKAFHNSLLELVIMHASYYEHYKSFLVLLGQLVAANDKEFIQDLKKNFKDKNDVDARAQFEGIQGDPQLLSILVTAYLYHLVLEKIYFQTLSLNYDPVAERLFANGFVLYILLRTKLDFSLFEELVQHFGYPLCLDYCNDFKQIPQIHPFRSLRSIDDWMLKYNLWRLTLARARRLYLSLQMSLNLQGFTQLIAYFEPQLRWFLQWLNFLYFLPRVVMDLGHLAYHMHKFPDQDLRINQRLQIYFHRRWESLTRDALWFINGFLSIFVFTAGLGFLSFYVSALMQFLEVLLNVYIMIQARQQQEIIRDDILSFASFFPKAKKDYLEQDLRHRDRVDALIRGVRLQNSLGVLLCNILILPCFMGLHATVPLIGAVFALVMSVIQFSSLNYFNRLRRTLHDPLIPGKEPLTQFNSRYQLCQL